MLVGLYSPYKYGLQEHENYNILKFRNNIRFMQILEDRNNGGGGQVCPLYFDGAASFFSELPRPDDTVEIQKVYNYLDKIRRQTNPVFLLLSRRVKNKNIFKKLIKYGKNLSSCKKWFW